MTSAHNGMARFRQALRLLRVESQALCTELVALVPGDWDRPTNCDPWTVRVLVAHVVRGAESYLMGIERGLEGVLEPALSREQRTQRMHEIAARKPTEILSDLRAITERFEAEFSRLRPDQLDTLGYHSYGPRPARWFGEQRLAEVAFHRWDVLHSLGRPADLGAVTAAFLLPMLMEQNLPAIMGREEPRGSGSYSLAVRGESDKTWQVVVASGSVSVTRDGDSPCEVAIEGDSAALSLLIYGRHTIAELESAGRLAIRGDPATARRFHQLIRGP